MSGKIEISKLVPTQEQLRDYSVVEEMRKYALAGGAFTKNAIQSHEGGNGDQLIQISSTGDTMYVLDGHHRIVAKLLAGQSHLFECEYEITDRKLSDFNSLNLDSGWLTPFNPVFEVRLNYTQKYKNTVTGMIDAKEHPWDIIAWIVGNEHMYKAPRSIKSFHEFVDLMKIQGKYTQPIVEEAQ